LGLDRVLFACGVRGSYKSVNPLGTAVVCSRCNLRSEAADGCLCAGQWSSDQSVKHVAKSGVYHSDVCDILRCAIAPGLVAPLPYSATQITQAHGRPRPPAQQGTATHCTSRAAWRYHCRRHMLSRSSTTLRRPAGAPNPNMLLLPASNTHQPPLLYKRPGECTWKQRTPYPGNKHM
jgi:hypothetical protein